MSRFYQKNLPQIPTLQKLIRLGYTYVDPSQTSKNSRRPFANLLLEDILEEQLRKLNAISYRNKKYAFSDENIHIAIDKVHRLASARKNPELYELITRPLPLIQTIEGITRLHDLFYIDLKNWHKNVYHCTAEYGVEGIKSEQADIVLFINGIPIAIIECDSSNEDPAKAVAKRIHDQISFTVCEPMELINLFVSNHSNRNIVSNNVIDSFSYRTTQDAFLGMNDWGFSACEDVSTYMSETEDEILDAESENCPKNQSDPSEEKKVI